MACALLTTAYDESRYSDERADQQNCRESESQSPQPAIHLQLDSAVACKRQHYYDQDERDHADPND